MKKRVLSFFMAVCIVLGSIALSPDVFAVEKLSFDDHFGMYGAHLRHDSSITMNLTDSGALESFTLNMKIYADYAIRVDNKNTTSTVDDFYVVDRAGKYLVELWGGDGATLSTTDGVVKGGVGGYTYGIINLEVGDVLLYTLGGAGSVSGVAGEGGGANGGGVHGTKGSVAVGGGGGYSAIYLFRHNDTDELNSFYKNYVDSNGRLKEDFNINVTDRLSKYVMIAGGGGGAGAVGYESRGTANGGAGGYITMSSSTTSGELKTSDGYAVAGKFYSGLQGGTSDGSGENAGKGGSYIPGATIISNGLYADPNDWTGKLNSNLPGGSGGSGEYKGGSGGAGFAGGSGGSSGQYLSFNIGGGGGGSSFISVDFRNNIDVAEDRGYLIGRDGRNRTNENQAIGGLFHIAYLDEINENYLDNLDIEFTLTPFFDIKREVKGEGENQTIETKFVVENKYKDESKPSKIYGFANTEDEYASPDKIRYTPAGYILDGNKFAGVLEEDKETGVLIEKGDETVYKFTIPNVSLMPSEKGYEGNYLNISLTLVPRDGFAGGNDIPIFVDDIISVKPASNSAMEIDGTLNDSAYTGEIVMKNYCGYVNVPLNFNPLTRNHSPQGLNPGKTEYKISSLFSDKYADVRDEIEAGTCKDYRYYFIDSIGMHSVVDEFGNPIPVKIDGNDNVVSPDETTRYMISLTATPKIPNKPLARLTEAVKTKTFTEISVISVVGTGMDTLGNNMLVYNKNLEYNDGKYILSLHVSSDSSGSIEGGEGTVNLPGVQYVEGGDYDPAPITIPADGYYKFYLKGGDGGKGGEPLWGSVQGGEGGKGGALAAYFFIKKGTKLEMVAGANITDKPGQKKGGKGGSASYLVVYNPDSPSDILAYLMVASGGGGGGGSGALFGDDLGGQGATPNDQNITFANTQNVGSFNIADYTGGTGKDSVLAIGAGGTAKPNYVYKINTDFIKYVDDTSITNKDGTETVTPATNLTLDANAPAGGGVNASCFRFGSATGSKDDLGKYTFETAISKYFTVESVNVVIDEEVHSNEEMTIDTSVKQFNDRDNEAAEGDDYLFTKVVTDIVMEPVLIPNTEIYQLEFDYQIILVPREGFLGGNDVKVIEPAMADTGLFTGMKLTIKDDPNADSDYIDVGESRSKDYANVAIPQEIIEGVKVKAQDAVYVQGETTLYMSDLVSDEEGAVVLPDISDCTWEADYVEIVDPRNDNTLVIPENVGNDGYVEYEICAGIRPKVSEPEAVVRKIITPLVVTAEPNAKVYTDFTLSFDLYHITRSEPEGVGTNRLDDKYLIPFHLVDGKYIAINPLKFELTASEVNESGEMGDVDHEHEHHLPNKIKITVGDEELVEGVDYVYNRGHDSGEHGHHSTVASVEVYATSITGHVTVSAKACEEHHTLYYIYQSAPNSDDKVEVAVDKHYSELIDVEYDFDLVDHVLPDTYDHYTFEWDYGVLSSYYDEEDGKQKHVMPKGDAWVTGQYVPNNYDVTVKYLYEDGTEAAETHTESVPYNETFSITSPAIDGYIASKHVVSGTVTGNVEHTVTYAKAIRTLVIYYVYSDGSEAYETYTQEFTPEQDKNYRISSPQKSGYNPDIPVVEGTIAENGAVYTVTYLPVQPTITFDANGGTCSITERKVEYNNIYAYNVDSDAYEAFPIPIKLGAEFVSWRLGSENGREIKAGDLVEIIDDKTLVAKWKVLQFNVTVDYVTDTGTTVMTKSEDFVVGTEYTISTPNREGHTPDIAEITGIMPAQNLHFIVTYNRNIYTVTVNYTLPNGSVHVEELKVPYGDSFELNSSDITKKHGINTEEFIPNIDTLSGIVTGDLVYDVVYQSTAISVNIEWGAMTFSYDRGIWNPESHIYTDGKFSVDTGTNFVTVTNTSEVNDSKVKVEFAFYVSSAYPCISGKYTSDTRGVNEIKDVILTNQGNKKSTTAYFWLEDKDGDLGKMSLPSDFVAGNCSIILSE